MRNFKPIAATLILSALTCNLSYTHTDKDPINVLRIQVTKLLQHVQNEQKADENVRISFFFTNNKELVVLKTDARAANLDKVIKSRLNYQKIKISDLETNSIYQIKVQFKSR